MVSFFSDVGDPKHLRAPQNDETLCEAHTGGWSGGARREVTTFLNLDSFH